MQVQTLLDRFMGANGSVPMEGFTPMEIFQAVLDELWAEETLEHLVAPSPNLVTVAGVLNYAFDVIGGSTQLIAGVNDIRRIRGIYRPSLSTSNLSDYNYRGRYPFNQLLLDKRLYEGGLKVDNERRTVTFFADPGNTTDTWALDYYPTAPQLEESDEIPVLYGWEMTMLLPGMNAHFEEWKTGNSEYWRPMFDRKRAAYHSVLRNENELPRLDNNLYILTESQVIPQ